MDNRSYKDRKEYLNEYNKRYYHSNLEQKEKRKKRERERSNKNREAFRKWKETLSCRVCNESCSFCLEFHHLNSSNKDFTISNITSKNLSYIQKETAKCIVLCSNCHKKVHADIIQLVE